MSNANLICVNVKNGGIKRKIQREYLEVIDYQLFAVNTVEKRIGYYLWGYGK